MKFGERIIKLRKSKGLTQVAFAQSISISQGSLSDIEKNKSDPSFLTLQSIINRYSDINSNWLLTGEGEMYSKKDESNHLSTEEPPGEYVFFKKKDEIHRLDVSAQEVAELKKKIFDLEKEIDLLQKRSNKDVAKLMDENKKLNDELVQRLRQLTDIQMLLIPKQP